MQKNFFWKNRIEMRIMLLAITFMVGLFIFSAPLEKSRSSTSIDDPDLYSRNYLEIYCGSFANAVPMAVNPTATMAVLSIVGTIERSDEIWPGSDWLSKPRDFLGAIPLVRNAEQLPVANPWMAALFSVLAIALYVVRSIKACKAVSQETIDKVERIGGQVINVCLVLLQFSQVAMAEAATGGSAMKTGMTILSIVLGIITALSCAVAYFIVSKCIEGIEAIATGVPVVATNAISQVGKLFIHLFATIFQFVSVYLAAIFGLIFTIICLILLIKLQKYAVYYKYIYFNPAWRKLFNKGSVIEIVSKKFPRRGRKKFADVPYAIPVFSMKKYPKRLVNRELMWMIPVEGVPSLVRIRAFRKVKVYPLNTFYSNEHVLYMQKTKRFIRILTEEKDIEMIISSEYESYLEYLMSVCGAYDFKIVEDRRAAEKQEKIAAKKAAKEQAREERLKAREAAREERLKVREEILREREALREERLRAREEKRQLALARRAEKLEHKNK